ncbi:hypothetical protein E2C01_033760 [Portunus trituberculatus]|uniref:Uncharacterized protein n=1 Tax=Portunus trituberculatus TaxID=210409 RepID=A0A5B7F6I7_PORTR|nr:hypothetical protein [Portunus trituberculatus]
MSAINLLTSAQIANRTSQSATRPPTHSPVNCSTSQGATHLLSYSVDQSVSQLPTHSPLQSVTHSIVQLASQPSLSQLVRYSASQPASQPFNRQATNPASHSVSHFNQLSNRSTGHTLSQPASQSIPLQLGSKSSGFSKASTSSGAKRHAVQKAACCAGPQAILPGP